MKNFSFIANKVKQTHLIIDIKIQDSVLIIDLTRREKKKRLEEDPYPLRLV